MPGHTSAKDDVGRRLWSTRPWHVKNTFVEVGSGDAEACPHRRSGRTARSCQPRIRTSGCPAEPAGDVRCAHGGILAPPALDTAARVGAGSAASEETGRPEAEEATAVPGSPCQEQREQGPGRVLEKGSSGCNSDRPSRESLTIGCVLKLLEGERNHKCVFVSRRLNNLGFASDRLLASHFSAFGQVKRVLIAHSQVKRSLGDSAVAVARVRPGGIGFVVMVDAGAVTRILESGSEQVVAGKRITVEPFQLRSEPSEESRDCEINEPRQESLTIGGQLRLLQREHNYKCVFVTRRLSTLGFASDGFLASHFSAFGQVKRVLIAHSKVKRSHGESAVAAARVRPGGIGFVVMLDAGAVSRILQSGSEHVVAGKRITVEPFQLRSEPLEESRDCDINEPRQESLTMGAGAVSRILESGSEQVVAGKRIAVEPFHPGQLCSRAAPVHLTEARRA